VDLTELTAKLDDQAVKTTALTTMVENLLKKMEDAPAIRQPAISPLMVGPPTEDPQLRRLSQGDPAR